MGRSRGQLARAWALSTLVIGGATAAMAQDVTLPQRILDAKVLKVGIQQSYPPLNFVDPQSKNLTGFNVDLFNAMAPKLGVAVTMVIDAFPSLLPALDTGRSDLMGTGIFDSAQRRQKYTFVDYLTSGPVLMTTSALSADIKEIGDVCGRKVGIPRTVASFATVLQTFSDKECVGKGRPATTAITDDLPAQLGLTQRRYEAALTAQETLLHLQQTQPNSFAGIGKPLAPWLFGIAFKKEDAQLRDAIAATLDVLIKDGTYGRILAKYNMTSMAISQAMIDKGEY